MIAIIDYDAGNLTSVARAVTHLGFNCEVTRDYRLLDTAERIIFPGVGAAGAAMQSLRSLKMDTALQAAWRRGVPILGICLGTQIILGSSQENDTPCIGLLEGAVRAFPAETPDAQQARLKIPHMGWNRLHIQKPHSIFEGVDPTDEFYFVHSFYPQPSQSDHVFATTIYGIEFASVIGCRNLVATQFHLEKSGPAGLRMLKNFCLWRP